MVGEATQSWFKSVVDGAAGVFKRNADETAHLAAKLTDSREAQALLKDSIATRSTALLEQTGKENLKDALKAASQGTELAPDTARANAQSIFRETGIARGLKGLDHLNAAGHWMTGGGRGYGVAAARVGATWAGIGAVGAAYRYASGGTMTQNSDGERDIVGLPI